MRLLAIVSLAASCVLVALPASANPVIGEQLFIDFDPPNRVSSVYPSVLEPVDAYVVVDLEYGIIQSFWSVSFRLALSPGTGEEITYTNLLPDAVVEGDWYTGLTITTDCAEAAAPLPIGKLSFVYGGIPGDVTIEDHPVCPRWIVACDQTLYVFCVHSHGGVGKEALDGDCFGNAVEDASWSAIKQLYRP